MTDQRLKLGICVATNREVETQTFLKEWESHFVPSGDAGSPRLFSVFVHEDHDQARMKLPSLRGTELIHTCHEDIPRELQERAWIIPKGSGASRSFPMYLAWKAGCDYILTLDDDCLPMAGSTGNFFDVHLSAFRLDRWFRTIGGEEPRGIPYGDKGQLPVLLNHGLWTDTPDLDAPTALVRGRWPVQIVLRASREVIPPGQWFTLCAMNVCYHRSAIPAAYNLLMGGSAGFDRFDDIWSGLFLKRIADHLGYFITSGLPFVRHTKASNPFTNLRKEAAGIQFHEEFWRHIALSPLSGETTVGGSYSRLAQWVGGFERKVAHLNAPKGYFEKLSEAMAAWAALFDPVT